MFIGTPLKEKKNKTNKQTNKQTKKPTAIHLMHKLFKASLAIN